MNIYRVFLVSFALVSSSKPCYSQFTTIKILPNPIIIYPSPVYDAEKYPDSIKSSLLPHAQMVDTIHTYTESLPMLSQPFLGQKVVSSHFGYREDPFTHKKKFHAGTDYVTSSQNIFCIMPGKIKDIDYNKKLGNYITLKHGDFTVTYGHLFSVQGQKGADVNAGRSIGISGSTGRSTGEHLHISIKYKGKYVDPEPIINYIEDFISKVISPSTKRLTK
jgi:murein DD-endopeptidase MepM/ murein hydrolase activator NlpD